MKLFGIDVGKEPPMEFGEFRDYVRQVIRRAQPEIQLENREFGFMLLRDGRPPEMCNLRSLYSEVKRTPHARNTLVEKFVRSLSPEIPVHTWAEAQPTLRPVVKNGAYLENARALLRKSGGGDVLPHAPFAGDLSVIVMREVGGSAVAATGAMLEGWGVSFEQTMRRALDNLNMQSFPPISSPLVPARCGDRGAPGEEIGLIFDGDHLTASWVLIPRFRDYLSQRLQGDYVVHVPTRKRLTAVRADEPELISQVQALNRHAAGQQPWLTAQGYHVSGVRTGGLVTVYAPAPSASRRPTDSRSSAIERSQLEMATERFLWGWRAERTEDEGVRRR